MNNFEVLVLDLNIATILLLQYIDLIKKKYDALPQKKSEAVGRGGEI